MTLVSFTRSTPTPRPQRTEQASSLQPSARFCFPLLMIIIYDAAADEKARSFIFGVADVQTHATHSTLNKRLV
jgi:hypothetical protein